ncbi:hypothetical protein K505DRAFT_327439 [Melanomma pulvis-pyrius CBS 109.77]|uniref:Metallothionein n=1 Tax=Melanomma pulvis-pyrius CBS 109.77 TaxID=1314802 RepID=A0A6A6X3E0_9PLEO|nr:hypothetical protein K505DRAFT_327439 [Melanomma pulvis-pyrius CBS 109.77]
MSPCDCQTCACQGDCSGCSCGSCSVSHPISLPYFSQSRPLSPVASPNSSRNEADSLDHSTKPRNSTQPKANAKRRRKDGWVHGY